MTVINIVKRGILAQKHHLPLRSTLFIQHILANVVNHAAFVDVNFVHIALVVEVVEDVARSVGKGEGVAVHQDKPTILQLNVVVNVDGRRGETTDGNLSPIVVNDDLNANSVITDTTITDLGVTEEEMLNTT